MKDTLQIFVYEGEDEIKEKPDFTPVWAVSIIDPVILEATNVAALSYAPRAPSPFSFNDFVYLKLPA